jgi:hypothetical protein
MTAFATRISRMLPRLVGAQFLYRLKNLADDICTRTFDLPVQEPHGFILQSPSTTPSVTWVGHSTLLVQLDEVNILTDPPVARPGQSRFLCRTETSFPLRIRLENFPLIHLIIIIIS